MKRISTVLFDLDGTLLRMDQEKFLKLYFGALINKFISMGYEKDKFLKSILHSVDATIENETGRLNGEIFWQTFSEQMGEDMSRLSDSFEEFYKTDFECAKAGCGYNEDADRLIKYLKSRGIRVVLATNPVFPAVATERRMQWAGIDKRDFEFYTTFENSRYCKPNVKYYAEILEKLGVSPEECLMVGNDVKEDMVAETLGLDVFLLTDDLINRENKDISGYRQGNFAQLFSYFEEIL